MGAGDPFPGGKTRPGRDADHSPPSSADVKNEKELYLLSSQAPPWRVVGLLYFLLTIWFFFCIPPSLSAVRERERERERQWGRLLAGVHVRSFFAFAVFIWLSVQIVLSSNRGLPFVVVHVYGVRLCHWTTARMACMFLCCEVSWMFSWDSLRVLTWASVRYLWLTALRGVFVL
jgi:hypothetical protein